MTRNDPEGFRCGTCMQLCRNSRELARHENACEAAEMAERTLGAWPARLAEMRQTK